MTMLHRVSAVTLLLILLPLSLQAEEPLVKQVKDAIDGGIRYLKKEQQDRGNGEWSWENKTESQLKSGGASTLAVLALLTSGVPQSDPVLQRALPYIRSIPPEDTYVVGLQTMILAELNQPKDLAQIQKNVDWILAARVRTKEKFMGWGYGLKKGETSDNSNSQYALLGLLAGRQAGATITKKDWEEILEYYNTTQQPDPRNKLWGGWAYRVKSNMAITQTMTAAGVCGLLIPGLEANQDKQGLDPLTGIAKNCGVYEENDAVNKGLRWLANNFNFVMRGSGWSFYNIYGLERVGRLSGQRFIGDHDWYREGCVLLTGNDPRFKEFKPRDDGSWSIAGGGVDALGVSSTSFALLFLSKGRMPILISKLAYDAAGEKTGQGTEWNRKHHDARHMVDYASRELFRKTPLAWQAFDPRRTDLAKKEVFDEELAALLQSPILYMNGHKRPDLSERQKEMLRRYVEEGGFILGEACCGSVEFTEGFRELMKDIFRENPLLTLSPEHPVWKAHALVPPADFPKLEGIEMGCRTVVMLSPEPLAGYWEELQFEPKQGVVAANRGQLAYRLAGNIIAYATGMELPRVRLDIMKPVERKDATKLPRHSLKIAQLKLDIGYRDAPQAVRNLAGYLRETYRLDVSILKEEARMSQRDLAFFPILYMHGRGRFTVEPEELKNLRETLEVSAGGVLLADACCGKKEFDEAFRDFVKKLYPNQKLEPIKADDFLFSEQLNGKGRGIVRVRCRTEKANGTVQEEFQDHTPELEGIKIDGRWVVIYSRYDLGCALEKSRSTACRAYDHESALKLASAVVLYALRK